MLNLFRTNLRDRARKATDNVRNVGRNAYYAGVGVYAMAEEETKSVYDRLVDKGRTYDEKRPDVVKIAGDRLRETGRKVEDRVEDTVSKSLHRVGVPSRDEIRTLIDRVESLTAKVDSINEQQAS